MDPKQFLQTVYLGDRACKSLLLDGWNNRVCLQIDTISRIRSASGAWEYYCAEDIQDGLLVFTGVHRVDIDPPGFMPNDQIEILSVEPLAPVENNSTTPECYSIHIQCAAHNRDGKWETVDLHIVAEGVHLEDPARPGLHIND